MKSSDNKFFDLTKDFRFETAHRLVNDYKGKCANLHGHSWNGTVTLRCSKLDAQGMGIDYADIKERITNAIDAIFDHATVLYREDPLVADLRKYLCKVVVMDENPTSEVIGAFIFDMATKQMADFPHAKVVEVVIKETCTSACRITDKYAHPDILIKRKNNDEV